MSDEKEKLFKEFYKLISGPDMLSVNGNKKIATYETILRFYQNSMNTFALESHKHYPQDIVTDEEHKFATDEELNAIHKFMQFKQVTDEQIDALFEKNN